MRGIKRFDKDEAVKLLREGISPVQISKQLFIPLSTVTTWLKEERHKQGPKISATNDRIQAIANAKAVNEAEANIVKYITPYIMPSITDEQWIRLEEHISQELKNLAFKMLS